MDEPYRTPTAAAKGNPDGEVADGEVQQAAHDIPAARASFEDAVLGHLCRGVGSAPSD
jgi:hypothetical protein